MISRYLYNIPEIFLQLLLYRLVIEHVILVFQGCGVQELVSAERVVKLSDFGMTRPMYESDYYRFNRRGEEVVE